ncbi:TPA: DUF1642 domain-containing protein, partial [Listeria monocytogenes]
MRFKKGDKVEFIWQGEVRQGVVTEIKAVNSDIFYYQVKNDTMGMTWHDESNLVSPTPIVKVPQCVAD